MMYRWSSRRRRREARAEVSVLGWSMTPASTYLRQLWMLTAAVACGTTTPDGAGTTATQTATSTSDAAPTTDTGSSAPTGTGDPGGTGTSGGAATTGGGSTTGVDTGSGSTTGGADTGSGGTDAMTGGSTGGSTGGTTGEARRSGVSVRGADADVPVVPAAGRRRPDNRSREHGNEIPRLRRSASLVSVPQLQRTMRIVRMATEDKWKRKNKRRATRLAR